MSATGRACGESPRIAASAPGAEGGQVTAWLEVGDAGIGNSIQDAGRFGYRNMGITVSGWLDPLFARCANALVGNPWGAACIEVRGAGPSFTARDGRIRVAVVGDLPICHRRADGLESELPGWASVTLEPGDELEVGVVLGGVAYVAVGGGIATPVQLGSRSTYERARIGGIGGRLIEAGDRLPCAAVADTDRHECAAAPWLHGGGPFRVILGPQLGHFLPEAVQLFLGTEFEVTPQRDRMGMRLAGSQLTHLTPQAADIVSDGVTPGAIQVPGNGQPIILLADCQTVGGYPKIATVIAADLPRLAQLKVGHKLRFRAVDAKTAKAALVEREARWRAWCGSVRGRVVSDPADEDDLDACCAPI